MMSSAGTITPPGEPGIFPTGDAHLTFQSLSRTKARLLAYRLSLQGSLKAHNDAIDATRYRERAAFAWDRKYR